MTELSLKEIKCESIGGYMVISSPFMDDEVDLLAWTNELTYPTSTFNAVDSAPENGSSTGQEFPPGTGRKRSAWDGDERPPKRAAQRDDPSKPEVVEKHSPAECDDSGESSLPLWQNDGIENGPAAYENSLSGLGSATYNINENLLSSPSLTVFKQEDGNGESSQMQTDQDSNCTLQRLLQGSNYTSRSEQDCRFQYVLAAATSIASKQGEETLTYLNQGQSYGIKLKKVGELLGFKGKLLKSVIRLQFHERRLQYSEKEQILTWQASRPGERIVELDVPLSYGLFDVEHDNTMVNTLSFCWDPTQEVGAYIKVNSISTEFTPKKHGGEKGVPFRIQVETYIEGDSYRLHAAACQIRVFKLKGADRKHKQEREKWFKLPESERTKYQPPYESTVLTDLAPDAVVPAQPFVSKAEPTPFRSFPSPRQVPVNAPAAVRSGRHHGLLPALPDAGEMDAKLEEAAIPAAAPVSAPAAVPDVPAVQSQQFLVDMGREQVASWMVRNGLEMLTTTFSHFNGTDMLRLTRQDLVTMCGVPHGTRLYYALRSKPAIRLTMYVNLPGKNWYHAVYLQTTTVSELAGKLSKLLNLAQIAVSDLFLVGPNSIRVLVNDELLGNLNNETSFSVEVTKDDATERCCLLLRATAT